MAQVMGPPLSPRETRRSGRRSGPSLSHSPESDISPRLKEPAQRPPLLSTLSGGSNGRHKRPKQEDVDDLVEDRKNGAAQSVSTSSNSSTQGSTKSKRKPKEKEKPPREESSDILQPPSPEMTAVERQGADEEEEGGITRCICGNTEDDPDAGEFMVQCETCKVWQHGLCMGFESEDMLHDGDYYCEQCRPDMHLDILKKLSRRPRQSSANSHHTTTRLSRSKSPHQATKSQPSKRRNTMNSAFDENLKQILETTAIEAGADPTTIHTNDQSTTEFEELPEMNNRNKKRKRAENETTATKKHRSMSITSDQPPTVNGNEETEVLFPPPPPPAPPASKSGGRNKRGGRKSAVVHDVPVDNGDGVAAAQPAQNKRSGNSHRKGAKGNARPPQSNAGNSHASGSHDSRRAQGANSSANAQTSADSRAYRNSHAYVVSQQPLYTSWNLPDYLSHLEGMLPTNVPKPLEVVAGAIGRESIERTTERGVKVKWPSKRTSVADMNKRVRALVEWVGREQASASDRTRRCEALEKTLKENVANASGSGLDILAASSLDRNAVEGRSIRPSIPGTTSSMRDMEALMEELILFQEKFGPGARRERRIAS
ncbi:hypothetical protein J3R30DRAFT_3448050 [Lentinula aciculospora]|uniref:PHD-type domain-containing protein n=1 Tax=Lentinula aciculospora TaxID=153920 RepID=A0A9W9AIM9_9AGAR|nr:hypothetical protein J3R30DRAFT_3448050 [Lentinula aciculospora]